MPKAVKSDSKKSVLIVEDSLDFSNLLKFIVEDDGFEGIQFPVQQEDILSAVKAQHPSVILMDLALRRKGGMEYINDLKNDNENELGFFPPSQGSTNDRLYDWYRRPFDWALILSDCPSPEG